MFGLPEFHIAQIFEYLKRLKSKCLQKLTDAAEVCPAPPSQQKAESGCECKNHSWLFFYQETQENKQNICLH